MSPEGVSKVSDKCPQVMSLGSTLLGSEDYKF